jgi:hypothetical protein
MRIKVVVRLNDLSIDNNDEEEVATYAREQCPYLMLHKEYLTWPLKKSFQREIAHLFLFEDVRKN